MHPQRAIPVYAAAANGGSRARAVFADARLLFGTMRALAVANLRYWCSCAPLVRAQLHRWERRARRIEDPALHALALGKLRKERFNAEVAATLATLAPRAHRARAIEAIVALEVMYDYLDGLTEEPSEDPLCGAGWLFRAFTDAVAPDAELTLDYYRHSPWAQDGGYLEELAETVREALRRLPAAALLAEVMHGAAARCAEAQVRVHAAPRAGQEQLERWARAGAVQSGLGWREFLAGAEASVLVVHALIAVAADARTTRAAGLAIDRAYLSIAALSTILDSRVDYERDIDAGRPSFIEHYEDDAPPRGLLADLAEDAVQRARALPRGTHHVMTVLGVVAYYISAPEADSAPARAVLGDIRRRLRPLLTPTLAVMRAWRLAKRMRELWQRVTSMRRGRLSAAPLIGVTLTTLVVGFGLPRRAVADRTDERVPAARMTRATRTLAVTDAAQLRFVRSSGSLLVEEGSARGTLPGSMRVHCDIGPTVSASFTIYTSKGSIRGHGTATPHGTGVYESFAGSIVVTGGTGSYAHVRGHAGLYGVFDRRTYDLTIQTTGRLAY